VGGVERNKEFNLGDVIDASLDEELEFLAVYAL